MDRDLIALNVAAVVADVRNVWRWAMLSRMSSVGCNLAWSHSLLRCIHLPTELALRVNSERISNTCFTVVTHVCYDIV